MCAFENVTVPVVVMSAIAYYILVRILVRHHGRDSSLARAVGSDRKGMASVVIYLLAIIVAAWDAHISCALYVIVAVAWLIPDRRIERMVVPE